MPIKSMAPHFGTYSPSDLNFLQGIYDEATVELTALDDMTMTDIAQVLLDAHRSGVRDREELLGIATSALYRRTA